MIDTTNVYRPLRAILLAIFFLLAARTASAQFWARTGGPTGAQVSAMTFAPDGALYTGTQTGDLYRSTDDGESWTRAGAGLPVTAQWRVLAAPNGSIFVTTYDSGAYRSTDRGGSWRRITSAIDSGKNKVTWDIAADSSGRIYLAKETDLFRSSDDGATWTKCAKPPGRTIGSIMADSRGRLFATALGSLDNNSTRLLRSTDQGDSWTVLKGPADSLARFGVRIDRYDRLTAVVSDSNLYRSTDGGLTWVALKSPAPGSKVDAVYAMGDLMFASTNEVYLHRSTDAGATWHIADSSLYDISPRAFASRGDGKFFFGDHFEGVYRSDDSGRIWRQKRNGMVSNSVVDMLALNDGLVYASTDYTGVYRSTDRGQTWERGTPYLNGRAEAQIRMLARGPRGDLFACGFLAIYRSGDEGRSWTKVADCGIPNVIVPFRDGRIWVGTETGLIFSADSGSTWRYASSTDQIYAVAFDSVGRFYSSTDKGTLRAGFTIKGVTIAKVIEVHPNGSVYLSEGTGIRVSLDSGKTFLPKALASKTIISITFARNGQAYAVAQNDGVYRQIGDTTWEPVNDGLPRKFLTGVTSGADGYLYVSTWTNSVFRSAAPVSASVPVSEMRPAAEALDLLASPNPFGDRGTVGFTLRERGVVTVALYDQLGREVARPADRRAFEAGRHEIAIDGEGLPAGIYHVMVRSGDRAASMEIIRR